MSEPIPGSKITGETSDGYHTFNELYEHRCILFVNLCLAHADRAYWRPHYEGWPLIGLELSEGQVTYHVPEKLLPLFKDKIKEGGPEFDGHTSPDVVARLTKHAEGAASTNMNTRELAPGEIAVTHEQILQAFSDWTVDEIFSPGEYLWRKLCQER